MYLQQVLLPLLHCPDLLFWMMVAYLGYQADQELHYLSVNMLTLFVVLLSQIRH